MKRLIIAGLVVAVVAVTAFIMLPTRPLLAAVPLGQPAPDFTLAKSAEEQIILSELADKTVVLEWFNKECPFVKKHYRKGHMQALQQELTEKGVVWLTIDSTHSGHRSYVAEDQRASLTEEMKMKNTAYLADVDGAVGKLYGAKTTPHMFIIEKGIVVYRGAIDDKSSTFANPGSANNYVRAAFASLEKGEKIASSDTKPYGCSVKYAD